MNKQDLQAIVAQFTSVGNISEQIFTKENVTDDINAYCFFNRAWIFCAFTS